MPRTVWFPGHMAKGRRELVDIASKLDLIIEVRDARGPIVTSSPMISSLAAIKPVWVVLSKRDLADESSNARWISYFSSGRTKAWAFNLLEQKISPLKKEILKKKPGHREVRLAVVGIPNVGKSLLLNQLIGKSIAKVGRIPGVTRGVSWFKGRDFMVVDSPGILDPKSGPLIHKCLAWLGCTKAEVTGGYELLGMELAGMIKQKGLWHLLENKWGIPELDEDNASSLERIGKRLGCLVAGGRVDLNMAGMRFIDNFSSGKIGRFTLEQPSDIDKSEEPC